MGPPPADHFFISAPGDPCTSNLECNCDSLFRLELAWADHVLSDAIYCNVSSGTGVCGGAGADVDNDTGVDFGRDYCASGWSIHCAH
jgi:hypothetical protein